MLLPQINFQHIENAEIQLERKWTMEKLKIGSDILQAVHTAHMYTVVVCLSLQKKKIKQNCIR